MLTSLILNRRRSQGSNKAVLVGWRILLTKLTAILTKHRSHTVYNKIYDFVYKLYWLFLFHFRQLDIFISEVLSIDYEVAKQKSVSYPRLQVVGASAPFAESGYSYAFKKNSPWKPKFDLVINRMKAENVWVELIAFVVDLPITVLCIYRSLSDTMM